MECVALNTFTHELQYLSSGISISYYFIILLRDIWSQIFTLVTSYVDDWMLYQRGNNTFLHKFYFISYL